MLELTYIGHAGWVCKSKNFKCLFDPWISKEGAFFKQWFPFPDNSHIDTLEVFKDLDFLYISHAHQDHFCEETLRSLDRKTKILIPKFKDKTLFSKLKELGFKKVLQVNDNQELTIKDIKIRIIKDEGHLDNDSCILIDNGKSKILNLNDCHADFSKLKKEVGPVDVLLLQASSALWWPCTYAYDEKEMQERGKTKRNNILKRALKYSQFLEAKMTIPNAGPPIFNDKNMEKWNFNRDKDWNPFCLHDKSRDFLIENGVNAEFLIPGDKIKIEESIEFLIDEDRRKEIYSNPDDSIKLQLEKIENSVKKEFLASEAEKLEMIAAFSKQLSEIKRFSKFYVQKIDFPVLFDFKEIGKWILDFSKEKVFIEYNSQEYNYSFTLDPGAIVQLFKNKSIDFEHYFLGCDFKCSRNPDDYNEYLFAMLKHFDTRRFMNSEFLYGEKSDVLDELFVLEHEGESYEVQKYCPHMYADLEQIGYVDEDRNFVCPLHGWKFNLESGECTDKKSYCIKVKKVKEKN